jgi:hypothetical protein
MTEAEYSLLTGKFTVRENDGREIVYNEFSDMPELAKKRISEDRSYYVIGGRLLQGISAAGSVASEIVCVAMAALSSDSILALDALAGQAAIAPMVYFSKVVSDNVKKAAQSIPVGYGKKKEATSKVDVQPEKLPSTYDTKLSQSLGINLEKQTNKQKVTLVKPPEQDYSKIEVFYNVEDFIHSRRRAEEEAD